jgi:hypothetical protein
MFFSLHFCAKSEPTRLAAPTLPSSSEPPPFTPSLSVLTATSVEPLASSMTWA